MTWEAGDSYGQPPEPREPFTDFGFNDDLGRPKSRVKPTELWVMRAMNRERRHWGADINGPEHFYAYERFREIRDEKPMKRPYGLGKPRVYTVRRGR